MPWLLQPQKQNQKLQPMLTPGTDMDTADTDTVDTTGIFTQITTGILHRSYRPYGYYGYYGKRSAEAEPAAEPTAAADPNADADAWYGHYGYGYRGYGWGGYYRPYGYYGYWG